MISSSTENRLQVFTDFNFTFSLLLFCWVPWDRFFKKIYLLTKKRIFVLLKLKQDNFEEKCLRIFHNALNKAFKKTIFVDEVGEACKKVPPYTPLIEELEYFLRCSQKYFYSEESFTYTAEQKERFCRLMDKLALIEKGLA